MRRQSPVVRTRTSRYRPVKRPKVASLFCAEGLRAPACVVLDALGVRGWSVSLQTGDAAREALKRFRDPTAGLRVLCLSEPLDHASQAALRRALDPLNRGDLLIVDFFTPRSVVEHILKFSGYRVGARRPTRGRRTTRSYLAQPTLIESPVDVGYWSRYGVGAAAAGVAILSGMSTFVVMGGGPGDRTHADATAASAPAEPRAPSPLIDRSTLSATLPVLDVPLPPRPRRAAALPPQTKTPPEPAATLEEVPLPEIPIEGLVAIERPRTVPSDIGRGGAPGLLNAPSLHTIDPFDAE